MGEVMRFIAATLIAVAALAPALPADAQPEDRRRAPTAAGSASFDPCVDAAQERPPISGRVAPGFDPRAPAPAGATSFTGIAPPSRDPSRDRLPPPTADTAYRDCMRRLGR
jgi:hypothetical protein